MNERIENKRKSEKVLERTKIYDKSLLINEEFSKMINSLYQTRPYYSSIFTNSAVIIRLDFKSKNKYNRKQRNTSCSVTASATGRPRVGATFGRIISAPTFRIPHSESNQGATV